MAGRTPYYGLGYFDFRDRLDAAVSVRLEQERFLTIDRQIFGMYSLFGNGVVSGMSVTTAIGSQSGTSVYVSPGVAFVQGRAVYIDSPAQLSGLSSGDTVYVFLRVVPGFGPSNGSIFWSPIYNLPNAIRLAKVTSGAGVVNQIDNSVKQQISFRSLVLSEIAKHKHRGSPSRIDLLREVKNFLPGARVGDLDAEQIASGQLAYERMPRMKHSELQNAGTLSHAGLESLARSLQTSDRVLLGEVTAVNQLQQNIAFRKSHPNHADHHINTITYVPGTATDSIVDFGATTAAYSPGSGCIAGKKQTAGTINTITFDTEDELKSHYAHQNILVLSGENTGITLTSTITEETVLFAESFENGADSGVPGFSFTVETTGSTVGISGDVSVQADGVKSAKLRSGVKSKVIFRKIISSTNNWSNFNKLFMYVRCIADVHPAVSFYLVNQGTTTTTTAKQIILTANEVTTNPVPAMDNFKLIEYDLTPFERGSISSMVFEIEDGSVDFSFNIDDVRTSTTTTTEVFFQATGFARYRYVANSPFIVQAIEWNAGNIPATSGIELRYRYGNSAADVDSALFEGPLPPTGELLNVTATIVDVEVSLRATSDRSAAPVFKDFSILMKTTGDESGFVFSRRDQWDSCELSNAEIVDLASGLAGVRIKPPLDINKIFYASNDSIQQLKEDLVAEFGYMGADLPISPAQSSRPSSVWSANGLPTIGFDQVSSISRTSDKGYIVSDTYNNRVLQISRDAKFVRGVGNAEPLPTGGQFVPLCAVLNPRTRILQMVFSDDVAFEAGADKTKFTLVVGSTSVKGNALDEVVTAGRPPNVFQIKLSADKVLLATQGRAAGLQIFCRLEPSVIGRTSYSNSNLLAANYTLNGLRLFVGDFTYLNSVYHPVSAEDVGEHWLVCNSTINFDRIRAGLRPDSDEYFLNIAAEENALEFRVSYRFPDDNPLDPNGNPYIVSFLNDPTKSGHITPVLQGTPAFSGTVAVDQDRAFSSILTITPGAGGQAMVGTTYLLNLRVRIEQEVNGNLVQTNFSPANIQLRVTVVDEEIDGGDTQQPTVPTVVKLRKSDWAGVFAFGGATSFAVSDFTLGSAVVFDEGRLLLSGVDFQSGTAPPINSWEVDAFVGQALAKHASYRGRVVVVNESDGTRAFQYTCPDGLYASDVSVTADGLFLVAESAIGSSAGRIVRVDPSGQVVGNLSNGTLGVIHDARETGPGLTMIST